MGPSSKLWGRWGCAFSVHMYLLGSKMKSRCVQQLLKGLKQLLVRGLCICVIMLCLTGPVFSTDWGAENSKYLLVTKKALEWIENESSMVFVDIRGKNKYDKVHIPDSIQVDPRFLAEKKFLKNKKVVIIYGGINIGQAVAIGKEAILKGFSSIHVLWGGLAAWKEAGKRVIGTGPIESEIYGISPLELHNALQERTPLYVIDTRSSAEFDKCSIDGSINVQIFCTCGNLSQAFRDHLSKQIARVRKTHEYFPIVLLDRSGECKSAIHDLRRDKGLKQVFYLRGGMNAYQDFRKNMKRILVGKRQLGRTRAKQCP